LYVVDTAGTREPVRVTYTDGFDGLPVFSPDGSKLCWTSGRTSDGQSQLFMAKWDHRVAAATLEKSPRRGTAKPSDLAHHHAHGPAGASVAPSSLSIPVKLSPDISTNDLVAHVRFLASPDLEGRGTGSKGAQLAASYIVSRFQEAGLSDIPSAPGYLQPFEFSAGVRLQTNGNHLSLSKADSSAVEFEVEKDFRPLAFSATADVSGEVVFVGYGLAMPGKGEEGYDSYAGVDVTNKIALALRYVPEQVEPKRRAELNRYAALRYKAMLAREHGARAILFVTGPNSPNAGELTGMAFDASSGGSGIAACTSGSCAGA